MTMPNPSIPRLRARLDWPVRVLLALCLAAASIVHINDLWQHGWLPYRFAPLPLNVYWTALASLDALAALLLLARLRAGLALTLLIIVSDLALNLLARFYVGLRLQTFALSLQVLFFVAVLTAHFMLDAQEQPRKPAKQTMKPTQPLVSRPGTNEHACFK
jgi:hypothetical protein